MTRKRFLTDFALTKSLTFQLKIKIRANGLDGSGSDVEDMLTVKSRLLRNYPFEKAVILEGDWMKLRARGKEGRHIGLFGIQHS